MADFPDPVGCTTSVSLPIRIDSIASTCSALSSAIPSLNLAQRRIDSGVCLDLLTVGFVCSCKAKPDDYFELARHLQKAIQEETILDIQRRQRGSVVILDISGRLTAGRGDAQMRDILREVSEQGHTHVLLNFDGLAFMDSAGLGSVVVGSKLLQSRGGKLAVMNARGPVRHVFQITRLDRVFPDYKTEEEAVASFAA